MRIALLGAGAMGSAAARLLARHPQVDLVVLDTDAERAERTVAAAGRGEGHSVDVAAGGLADALRGAQALASCVPYRLNLSVMEGALEARVPYADLGGLYHTTLRQLELDNRFRDAGVPAILGMGCCPGTSNVLARLAADRLDEVHTIDIFDGAADPGSGFGVPYSAETILDEFTIPAMVFEGGQLKEVPAGSGAIPYRFPQPVGELEAVYTLHSEIATLPRTIPGVRDVRWRLALPPEVAGGFRTLAELGLASEEPVDTPSGRVIPRDLLRTILARLPAPQGAPEDAEALVVEATGPLRGRPGAFVGTVLLRPTSEGIDAGAFGTAIPIATAARWLAEGRVPPGVHPPETALPATEFLADLAREGAEITVSVSESLGPVEAERD